tara:strand:- start:2353 stop:4311 length:1959 start_codon:yes stop_codon:yes gene_type:complete
MENDETKLVSEKLEEWVMDKCQGWRDNYDSSYRESHEEYYRLWRGIWAKEDSLRTTERSRIITPALQQAVESSVAEVEEATFGRGAWFDIRDDYQDEGGSQDVEFLKAQLTEDMEFAKARSTISEVLLNAAIYGTGIGEIYLDEIKEHIPAIQTTPDGQTQQVGVMEKERFMVKLRPIMPQNFLIDPLATSIEEALGCAIDMYVPLHQVEQDQEKGFLRDVEVETVASDDDLEPDQDITVNTDARVRLTRYYGLVPRDLLEEAEDDELEEDEIAVALGDSGDDDDSGYVEAIVIIANGTTLLKAVANPYMMEDRPVVSFKWDAVPSKFWGRGICEKGYNSQKALDTELRARIDALALTVHPMMAVDASRMPRGSQFEIRPGKTLLTNGNPSEILQPFKFGAVDNITFTQGAQLQNMVQQATGAVDTAGMASMGADGTAAGISMSLGAIIKRHKRTLLNFQDNFLIPFVQKVAHRYMQFDPDLYKAQDMKFVASSSLGIIAREYEVTQLVQLLQTMPAENPAYQLLVSNVVESMNLSKREQILAELAKANQPDPQAQEEQQIRKQFELELAKANLQQIQLQNQEIQSRIQQNQVETQLLPVSEETDRISAIAKTLPADEFQQAIEMAELSLKQQELKVKENIVELQMRKPNGN